MCVLRQIQCTSIAGLPPRARSGLYGISPQCSPNAKLVVMLLPFATASTTAVIIIVVVGAILIIVFIAVVTFYSTVIGIVAVDLV